MFIKEIYIDGFKSYATRTVLNGFDKSFNAITGLNGSGKSNILDAICFVLGISNLSQVRVNNLQELIYKQGQAGVTKASVSVVFDNSDPSTSPLGYEDQTTITVQRQIQIGGKNKYMINGRNAQLSRVQNLFHSVQLNVNNPHFLIMQGRITKVLNMKPIEILGMIEEAAGTRMFEMKKNSAEKTIEKKDKKLEEIRQLLSEEITPKLEKLKKDRSKYIQYNQNLEQIDSLERFCIAYDFFNANKQLEKLESEIKQCEENIASLQEQIKESYQKEQSVQKKIEKMKKQRQFEMKDEMKDLEKKVTKLSKDLIQKKSELDHKREEYERERRELTNIENQIKEEESNLEEKKNLHQSTKVKFTELKKKIEEVTQKIDNFKKQREAVSAGIAVNVSDVNGKTLTEQVMECKQSITNLKSSEKQNELRLTHLTKVLEEKKEQLVVQDKEETNLKKQLEEMEKEIKTIEQSMKELGFNEKENEEIEKQIETVESEIVSKTNKIKEMSALLAGVYLAYDEEKVKGDVKGLLANLFKIKDKKHTCALEVAAGPKLYQVVVDTEITAKELIEKGNINRRVTCVPLNNILYNTRLENKDLVSYIKQNNASPSIELIDYDKQVESAMKYCFSTTLVTEDIDTAEKVAFDKQVLSRTVTVKGDLFDPSGTLTGGSRQFDPEQSILTKLSKIRAIEEERDALIKKLEILKNKLDKSKKEKYLEIKNQLRLKQHSLTLLKKRIEQSGHFQVKKQIEKIEKEIKDIQEKKSTSVGELQVKEKEVVELETQLELFSKTSDEESVKQQKLELIEKNIEKTNKELKNLKVELKQIDAEKIELQVQEIEEEINELKKSYENKKTEIEDNLEKEFKNLEKKIEQMKENYDSENDKFKKVQSEFSKADEELLSLSEEKEIHSKKAADLSLQVKELEHLFNNINKSQNKHKSMIDNLLNQHKWIKKEKQLFGKLGTEYDFSTANQNPQQAKEKLIQLKSESEQLAKTINKKVMTMYEKAEQEYLDLMKKRGIVENDKKKIENVISDLDDKKKEAINKTWKKVNEDFGSIFSTLLPGTTCKLEPPSDAKNGALDGLEVKVAFNSVWKESLSELSGGQRSLIALSLILALLRFKPAPMYILDEIDAALDPSHTQNIGRMLKTHFSNSQFIVVSLKEGMFQNANALFKTKFVNGSSAVSRVTNHRSVVDTEREEEEYSSQEHSQKSITTTAHVIQKHGTKRKSMD
ncbi:hypothetical protein ABK040_004676 [Willaertia magna]